MVGKMTNDRGVEEKFSATSLVRSSCCLFLSFRRCLSRYAIKSLKESGSFIVRIFIAVKG